MVHTWRERANGRVVADRGPTDSTPGAGAAVDASACAYARVSAA